MELRAQRFRAMGCPCELRLYGDDSANLEHALDRLQAEALRFERSYSRYRDDSVVGQANARAGSGQATPVDPETHAILSYADACYRESEGLFDTTSGIYRRLWHADAAGVPDQEAIDDVRSLVGWHRVHWDERSITLPEVGMEIDLGGVVKEYAADALATLAVELGIRHGLVNLGGDLKVIGPHPDGSPWQVGVTNPADRSGAIAVTQLLSGGIATSGSYERTFELGGRSFSHIINPLTGWPADELKSVSVLAPQTLVAGSLATIAMLKTEADAIRWLESLGVAFMAITRDQRCLRGGDLRP